MSNCGLCKRQRDLVSSHLIGASAYKVLRDQKIQNPNPIVISRDQARSTSDQLQKKFLCSECEQRFSKKGERVVLGQCVRDSGFPLRDKLKGIRPLAADEHVAAFDLVSVYGDDAKSFIYFPMSVFWRASATRWKDGRDHIELISLGPYRESFRSFLLDESPFPESVALIMQFATDEPNRSVAFPSSENQQGYRMHQFCIPGILFTAFVGRLIPPAFYNISMPTNTYVVALAGELSAAKLFYNFKAMAQSAKLSKKLKETYKKDNT